MGIKYLIYCLILLSRLEETILKSKKAANGVELRIGGSGRSWVCTGQVGQNFCNFIETLDSHVSCM